MEPVSNILKATGLLFHSTGPVDLSITGGDCLGLVGPSGSGKSLVLRMIADLVPHRGTCTLDGVAADDVPATRWRTWVRYVAAEPAWWAATVGAHFRQPDRLSELAKRLGLDPALMDAAPERLSTGERQRAAFMRAIEDHPRVLLLDEPTAALDRDAATAMEGVIRDRMTQGAAIILTSHDPAQVERLASSIVTLGARS